MPPEVAVELAGLSAQVQFGNYSAELHGHAYLDKIELVENQVWLLPICIAGHSFMVFRLLRYKHRYARHTKHMLA